MTSAAARICAAWQIAAVGLRSAAKERTIAIRRLSSCGYSDARPPAIIKASQSAASISANVA
jgi:hypothetical protein